jgi:NAD(P)-dependent dehydrogenase (short-subunit alcohol dehydrogenase family)
VRADVARADQVDGMVDRVLARFGRLDILVNNAGVMTRGQFLDVPIASYDSMFAINVAGTLRCTQRALRPMVAAR